MNPSEELSQKADNRPALVKTVEKPTLQEQDIKTEEKINRPEKINTKDMSTVMERIGKPLKNPATTVPPDPTKGLEITMNNNPSEVGTSGKKLKKELQLPKIKQVK